MTGTGSGTMTGNGGMTGGTYTGKCSYTFHDRLNEHFNFSGDKGKTVLFDRC